MLRVLRVVNALLEVNTYIAYNDYGEAFIVDPGSDADYVLNLIDNHGLKPRVAIATHLHFDHVIGLPVIFEATSARIAYCLLDTIVYEAVNRIARYAWGIDIYERLPEADIDLCSTNSLTVAGHVLRIIHVPGHSPGSIAVYEASTKIAFVGDLVFKGSVGRVDLPYGSYEDLVDSLKKLVEVLEPSTLILPGHGPSTTLKEELKLNPYLKWLA